MIEDFVTIGNDNKASIVQPLPQYISAGEMLDLYREKLITREELRQRLNFDAPTQPSEGTLVPTAIRKLYDGTFEHLFADGKRLLVPKESALDKSPCTSFSQLDNDTCKSLVKQLIVEDTDQ